MRRSTSRPDGWLPEHTVRSGIPEQWATNSGPDRLSVTLGYAGDDHYAVRSVRISNDGYQSESRLVSDIHEAREIFTERVNLLRKGRHAEVFD